MNAVAAVLHVLHFYVSPTANKKEREVANPNHACTMMNLIYYCISLDISHFYLNLNLEELSQELHGEIKYLAENKIIIIMHCDFFQVRAVTD